jgi:pyrroloquinoline quinone biosynthesis protein B
VSAIKSVSLTHLHLGHVDGLGLFGREVMGRSNIRLLGSKPVLDELRKRSLLEPFAPEVITNASKVLLGRGVSLEFHRVPHRDHEVGETHAIIVRGAEKSILFLPDHDTWSETLGLYKMDSIRAWLKHLSVDIALLDGTFFTVEEVAGRRGDAKGIPHPPVSESLDLLGKRMNGIDPEIFFIHLNHTNPIIDDPEKQKLVEELGWHIGAQGDKWEI